jgi:hypothetical protein
MRNKIKTAGAFLLGLSIASSVTWAQLGGRGRNVAFVDGTTISPTSVQASGTGDQFMCTATTAVCEVESSINATTMTATVPAFDIGPTATPGANDRLACFSYGPSGSKTRVACVDVEGDITATSLLLSATNPGARFHVLNESTIYTPSSFDEKYSLFGRNALSGASSGAVFVSYHTGDNEGVIGALSPAVAWRPLSFPASEWKFRPSGLAAIANITSTGAFNSVATSGNQAFTCTNTGCRLSLGNTGRYLVDDGTNLEFVAPVQGTSFEATTATGSSLTGGSSSGPLLFTSNTTDSFTSTTAGAFNMKPANALTSGDAILTLQDSAGNNAFVFRTSGTINTSGNTGNFVGRYLTAISTPVELGTFVATTETKPIRLGTTNTWTADDAQLVTILNGSTEIAHFSKDGLLRVNQGNAAKPTCNATNRGRVYYLNGGAGVADVYEICGKNAADVYAWKAIVTF